MSFNVNNGRNGNDDIFAPILEERQSGTLQPSASDKTKKKMTTVKVSIMYSAYGLLFATLGCVIGFSIRRENATTCSPSSGLPPGFVNVAKLAPRILVTMRYATNHNFMGRRVIDYNAPLCILTKEAATALKKVSDDVNKAGYVLKMYDCYRPQRSVDSFVKWSQNNLDTLTKGEFYPDNKNKSSMFPGYIALKSGHSRGSTMDLTLVRIPVKEEEEYKPGQKLERCDAPLGVRFGDNSIDMGSGFDCFSSISNTDSGRVSSKAHKNRMLLKMAMAKHGFVNYDQEFWHYTLENEPYKNTYFNFPIQDNECPSLQNVES